MSPRYKLTSAAFAIKAKEADSVGGIPATNLVTSTEVNSKLMTHVFTDEQIPDNITIDYSATSGNADTLDGKDATEFGDRYSLDAVDGSHADAVYVDGNGNVDIGTNNPLVNLHNNGDFITKGPWIDVRAYGAKGDGVKDDTTAVQDAVNSAGKNGVVFFPKGNYKLRQIAIPSDITLFAYKGKISNYAEPRLFYLENVSNVRIQGLEITAYTGDEWARTAVYMHDICSYIHLEDLGCIDHNRNHAIQYADNDDDGGPHARSFFFNITLKDIKITGSSSIQNSAGINFFPRKQSSNRPEAKNLFIDNLSHHDY